MLTITPSQTVGPYFAYGLMPDGRYNWNNVASSDLVTSDLADQTIIIAGTLFDGDGVPIEDGMLEIWQPDAQGRLPNAGQLPNRKFTGFGRCATSPQGEFAFQTIKPGVIHDPFLGDQAPHILLAVFARGMLVHAFTRVYFYDEKANASDPILQLVPTERRSSLIAVRQDDERYRFDIHLQGERETVFFEI
ncbi:MAG: protocatechuate 3,4-dioxygenase subunit alpha [Afipia sp.]|nr:protocatechuate 3,4-dioxygenase subunit alpha [Afipia sp.]